MLRPFLFREFFGGWCFHVLQKFHTCKCSCKVCMELLRVWLHIIVMNRDLWLSLIVQASIMFKPTFWNLRGNAYERGHNCARKDSFSNLISG